MYIATYGTLRHGGPLHSAISGCDCMGLYRIGGNYVMVITPAGYPAVVGVNSAYIRMLLRSDSIWWKAYIKANPDCTHDPSKWSGNSNGFDYPLLELYNVNSSDILRRLDIIEGVPHLYRREGISTYSVCQQTGLRCDDNDAYEESRHSFYESRDGIRKGYADSLHPYAEAYYMAPSSEWLQGCEIVWNGDYNNQIIHPTLRFDYVEWKKNADNQQPRRGGVNRFDVG